jgi:hypothetical protein
MGGRGGGRSFRRCLAGRSVPAAGPGQRSAVRGQQKQRQGLAGQWRRVYLLKAPLPLSGRGRAEGKGVWRGGEGGIKGGY